MQKASDRRGSMCETRSRKWTPYGTNHPLLHVCQQTRHEMSSNMARDPHMLTATIKQCSRKQIRIPWPNRWVENVVRTVPNIRLYLELAFVVDSYSGILEHEDDDITASSLARALQELGRVYDRAQVRDLEGRRKQDGRFERFCVNVLVDRSCIGLRDVVYDLSEDDIEVSNHMRARRPCGE